MLTLTFLQRPFVQHNGLPTPDFVSEKCVALLAYLALNPGDHSRELLASLLWGDLPNERAKANLRLALYDLRKKLPDALTATRKTAAFRHGPDVEIDVMAFEAASAETDPISLANAIARYENDLLAGLSVQQAEPFEAWLRDTRQRLRLQLLDMLTRLAALQEANADWNAAANTLRRILSVEPWDETILRRLMLMLARQGKLNAALAQYQTSRRILADELGVDSAPATERVYERVQALRQRPRHNLPPQPTPFLGRDALLDQLQSQLRQLNCRLMSLIGSGGIGKTRLALALANALQHAFVEGVAFVPLADMLPSENMADRIADTLRDMGLLSAETAHPDSLTALTSDLHDAELLLVVDNLEHLLDQLHPLLALLDALPNLTLLTTSRERLNVRWEQAVAVSGLTVPTLDAPSAEIDSMALFERAAQRIDHRFTLNDNNLGDVARICRQVEGMPLALELAAGWLRSHTCADIAERMAGDLTQLTTHLRDATPHHRSISAVVERSWQLLTSAERTAFMTLSVFRGGFTAEAAHAVGGVTPDLLQALVDKSLVRQLGVDGEQRYDIHMLLRQFGELKLGRDPDQHHHLRQRHAIFIADWLAALEPHLKNDQQLASLQATRRESDNIHAAWQWAGDSAEIAVFDRSMRPLAISLLERGQYREGLTLFEAAIAALMPVDAAQTSVARLCLHVTRFRFRMGQIAEARAEIERCLPILQAADADWETAMGLRGLALTAESLETLLTQMHASTDLFRLANDRYEVATNLLNIAAWLPPRQATPYLAEAAELLRALGERLELARALTFQATALYRAEGAFEQAHGLLQEALTLQGTSETEWTCLTLSTLGQVQRALGEFNAALATMTRCEEILARLSLAQHGLGYRFERLLTQQQMGMAFSAEAAILATPLDASDLAHNKIDVCFHHLLLAMSAWQSGDATQARHHFEQAATTAESASLSFEQMRALNTAGWFGLAQGWPDAACEAFLAALELAVEAEARPSGLESLVGLAMSTETDGNSAEVQHLLAFVARHPATPAHFRTLATAQLTSATDTAALDDWVSAVGVARALSTP